MTSQEAWQTIGESIGDCPSDLLEAFCVALVNVAQAMQAQVGINNDVKKYFDLTRDELKATNKMIEELIETMEGACES